MSESSHIIPHAQGDQSQNFLDERETRAASGSPAPGHEDLKVQNDSRLRPNSKDKLDVDSQATIAVEEQRPPLPPRPRNPELLHPGGSLQGSARSPRPHLQSIATTALSSADIHTQSFRDGSRQRFADLTETATSGKSSRVGGSLRRFGWAAGEVDDSASMKSFAPTIEASGDVESLLGEVLGVSRETPPWKLLSSQSEEPDPFDIIPCAEDPRIQDFEREFDEISELDAGGDNEGFGQELHKLLISLSHYQSISCHSGRLNGNISLFCHPPGNRYTAGMAMII